MSEMYDENFKWACGPCRVDGITCTGNGWESARKHAMTHIPAPTTFDVTNYSLKETSDLHRTRD